MKRDPIDNDTAALLVAALPGEFSERRRRRLLERGFKRRSPGGTLDRETQVEAVEQWGLAAWKPAVRSGQVQSPLVEDPGEAAVDAALAAICIKNHPTLVDLPADKLQGLANLCELYTNTLQQLIAQHDDRELEQELAEMLYAKPPEDGIPHPGRVCTGVGTISEFDDDRTYIQIPMVAASETCLARGTSEGWGGSFDPSDGDVDGRLYTRVQDNSLYIPRSHCAHLLEMRLRNGGFSAFVTELEDVLTTVQFEWITGSTEAITDRIDRFERAGQYGALYTDWDPQKRLFSLLQDAASEQDEFDSEQPFTASEIFHAIDEYDSEGRWEQKQISRFASPRATQSTLEDLVEAGYVCEAEAALDGTPQYCLDSHSSRLSATTPADLFELPCMQHMDTRLREKGPVRKDLFNFARMVMWLPQYQDASREMIVEDLMDVFERWPWFDPEETRYQVEYEFDHGEIEGQIPLPMNCDNPDMQRYCIGKDACPYSIYGSLPFPEEMYDQLDSDNTQLTF